VVRALVEQTLIKRYGDHTDLVIRLPSHPPFKHLSCTWDVEEEFFQVDVFVPDLSEGFRKGEARREKRKEGRGKRKRGGEVSLSRG
jgi:hypothetical protein